MNLIKIVTKSKKRIGRGHGSGKVKTAGRGTKGQNARSSVPAGFEGGQLALIKRVPLLRGKGRNKSRKTKPFALSIGKLEIIPKGTTVTLEVLRKYRMISKRVFTVKIVAGGILTHALVITFPCSKTAKNMIEKAGGKVIIS